MFAPTSGKRYDFGYESITPFAFCNRTLKKVSYQCTEHYLLHLGAECSAAFGKRHTICIPLVLRGWGECDTTSMAIDGPGECCKEGKVNATKGFDRSETYRFCSVVL